MLDGIGRRVRAAGDAAWTTDHRIGVGLVVASAAVTIAVGFAGPSVVTLTLGPRTSLLPPWYLPVSWGPLPEWIAVPALWLGILLGALGLWIAWRALAGGWRPDNHRLFGLGALLSTVTALVPALTSADVLMYAAYGRIQLLGLDPYETPPAAIFRQEFDPVLYWTERPWQDTPSVYGPLASASQWLAAWLGGGSMHDTVFWLQLFCLVPFLLTGLILYRLTRDEPAAQSRAVLFTVLNPLMIWAVVAGAHNEPLALVFAIAGLAMVRRNPLLAGIGIGLAGTVKVSLVWCGLAMLWAYRHEWRKILQYAVGALIPMGLAYGLWVPKALLAARRNTGYIFPGGWAQQFHDLLLRFLNPVVADTITGWAGWAGMVVIAWMLSRVLPWRLAPGLAEPVDPRRDPLTIAARTAALLTVAWVVNAPASLSWYDVMAWAPLALVAISRLDAILMWRGAWLSAAYVTSRSVQFSDPILAVGTFLRDWVSWGAQMLVLAAICWWWWRAGHEFPFARRSRRRTPTAA